MSQQPEPDAEVAPEKSSGGRGCLYIIAAFMFFVGSLVAGLPLITDAVIQAFEPDIYRGVDEFVSKPISFPTEWKKAAPLAQEFVRKTKDWSGNTENRFTTAPHFINSLRENSSVYVNAIRGFPLPETTWTLLRTAMKDIEPLRLEAIPMMTDPDFDLQALNDVEGPGIQEGLLYRYDYLLKQIALETAVLVHDGNSTEAARLLAMAISTLKCEEVADPGTLYIRYGAIELFSHATISLSRECFTSEPLRMVLEAMNSVYPKLNRASRVKPPQHEGTLLSYIVPIRKFRRQGYSFTIEENRPLLWYMDARRNATRTYLEDKLVTASPTQRPMLQAQLKDLNWEGTGSREPWFVRVLVGANPRLLTNIRMRNSQRSWTSDSIKRPVALFDLARLSTVEKLLMIEGRDPGTSLTELVPEFLPEVPKDPYARNGETYGFSTAKGKHYSLGPDGRDDSGQTSEEDYPTTGDLMLPIKPQEPGIVI